MLSTNINKRIKYPSFEKGNVKADIFVVQQTNQPRVLIVVL